MEILSSLQYLPANWKFEYNVNDVPLTCNYDTVSNIHILFRASIVYGTYFYIQMSKKKDESSFVDVLLWRCCGNSLKYSSVYSDNKISLFTVKLF